MHGELAHILSVKQQVLQASLPRIAFGAKRILASSEIERIEPLLHKLNS